MSITFYYLNILYYTSKVYSALEVYLEVSIRRVLTYLVFLMYTFTIPITYTGYTLTINVENDTKIFYRMSPIILRGVKY